MSVPLFVVDAFTDVPFRGNPAAVCLLASPPEAQWMQSVAAEMNLAETAFLVPAPGGAAWSLRWFTPVVEVPLCGHATLAAAHVLWETGRLAGDAPARFDTQSGRLTCTRSRTDAWIEMDFPAEPAQPIPDSEAPGLLAALGAGHAVERRRNRMDYFVELADAAAVRALVPDFPALAKFPVRGTIVTARSDDARYDFISRFFCPAVGINEDPVTGSAHCALGPHWAAKLGKTQMTAYQASKRGGVVRVTTRGDRVLLGGQAVTVHRGELVP